MTQHVRKGYRNHRKATLAGVIGLVALIAAAIAPFAIGAAPKYYTLAAAPPSVCSTPTVQTFTLVLTNQSRNNSLGSANITAPSYVSLINDGTATTSSGTITVNTLDGFDSTANTIRLRNLNLPTSGSFATITVSANVSAGSGGAWTSIAKQSNSFADSGPGNLFALSGSAPTTTVSQCHYAFVSGPVDASKNVAQPVTVQLQTSGGSRVTGSGSLSLTAYQGVDSDTALSPSIFTGLTASASNGEWAFSITGTVTGDDYSLKAPDGTRSSYFRIADCIPDASGKCTFDFTPTTDGSSGASLNGSGVGSPITLAFVGANAVSTGIAWCASGWNWSPMTFPPQPPDGRTTFDGTELSDVTYSQQTGYLKLTMYLRNDLYVQTSASQTNDIQVCVGAKHSVAASNTATADGDTSGAFAGRSGIFAKWDTATGLYWGVVSRVSNCSKTPDANGDGKLDPVLCAWGTKTINGIDYRTATVIFPYDWDLKGIN